MVTVDLILGLVMAIVTVMLSNMVLIIAVMTLMVVIAQKKSVPVAELKLLLRSRKVKSLQHLRAGSLVP
jgi:hypothetical protein